MSNTSFIVALVLCASLGSLTFARAKNKPAIQGSISLKGKSNPDYSELAKISLQDAIAAAIKSTPGKVTEAALDKEDGFLVYEIEMTMPDQNRKELLIDAGDGKILLVKEKNKKKSEDDDDEEEDDDE